MKGLYKGKYLIAVYDKDDFLIDVAYNPKELLGYKNKDNAYSAISHVFNKNRVCENIHFIDVTEKHDDIFAEEDEIFLKQFMMDNKTLTNKELSEKIGISERSYYRYKNKGTLYKLENKKEVDMKLKERQKQLDDQKYFESQKWQKDMSGSMPYCRKCEFKEPFLACKISHDERFSKTACAKAYNKMNKGK